MSVRTTITNAFRRPFDALSREWDRMAPRERRLIGLLGGAIVAVFSAVVIVVVLQTLSDIDQQNADTRDALAAIAKHRDEYLDAKSRMQAQEIRIGTEPPQLAADLENAAREVNIQIQETVPRQPAPAGRRYLEHAVDVTLRQVDLQSLTTFLSKLETGPRLILITKMNIKRGFADGAKLNVTLTATAFERVKDTGKKKAATGKEKT